MIFAYTPRPLDIMPTMIFEDWFSRESRMERGRGDTQCCHLSGPKLTGFLGAEVVPAHTHFWCTCDHQKHSLSLIFSDFLQIAHFQSLLYIYSFSHYTIYASFYYSTRSSATLPSGFESPSAQQEPCRTSRLLKRSISVNVSQIERWYSF